MSVIACTSGDAGLASSARTRQGARPRKTGETRQRARKERFMDRLLNGNAGSPGSLSIIQPRAGSRRWRKRRAKTGDVSFFRAFAIVRIMRWVCGILMLAAGCAPTGQERARDYNED